MSEMAINQVLAQMRSMAAEAGGESSAAAGGADFSSFMQQSIDDVNQAMQNSREMATAFEAGEPGVSLAELMVTAQKASLEFQALSEVRNKLLTAYREVMSMQV